MKILIFGAGWIGKLCKEYWGDEAILIDEFIKSPGQAGHFIEKHKPDAVLNAAGIVGKPNVDWCEDHQFETFEGNTQLPLLIANACRKYGVYMLHIGTGCIYYGYKDGGWLPEDYANPVAVYTRTKYAADLVLATLPNVGIARIRMPIHSVPSRANLIDKLASYPKVVDVENSATVVEDMQMAFYKLMEQKVEGIFHVVNPGSITHKEILKLYEEHVDENHTNEWITAQELTDLGLASKTRSNNVLNTESLEELGIEMRPIRVAVADAMEKYSKLKK